MGLFFWKSVAANPEDIKPMKWPENGPEISANIVSRILFWWIQPLFSRASYLHRRGQALQQDDLPPQPPFDHADFVENKFEEGWANWKPKVSRRRSRNDETAGEKQTHELESKLLHSLLAVCGRRIISAGFVKVIGSSLQLTIPLLVNAILKFFQDTEYGAIPSDAPGGQRYRGYWLSALLMLAIFCKAVADNAYYHKMFRCGYQIRTAVSAAVYTKSLRLSSSERQHTTLGELVNLMQVDAAKIEAFVPQSHTLWDGIFQITGYMIILGTLLGWPCITGLVVMAMAGPVQAKITGRLFGMSREMVKHTDDRVKTTNECLQAIRSVKMYTWEESFERQILHARGKELGSLMTMAYLRSFSRAYMTSLPGIVACTTFIVYAYATNQPILASTLFSALVAFNQLQLPLMFYPVALAQLAQAKVSMGRVANFLGMQEIRPSAGYVRDSSGKGKIVVENAQVYWSDPSVPIPRTELGDDGSHSEKSLSRASENGELDAEDSDDLVYPKPIISDVSFRVAPGELCAVVGRVGSGKSSLCSALLNETILGDGGKIAVHGKVAYVAQNAWIMNATVKDNILFGLPIDEDRYKKVLKTCQLAHDLTMLEDGDRTEIGERGINLSGGQKQRISVARAAYADADVIILDDPLSALDPEVGAKLFEECIVGFMKGKTRFLVTNQLQCLKHCDTVIALGKGRVIEQGTYSDLMNDDKGEVQRLLKDLKVAAAKDHADFESQGGDKDRLVGISQTQDELREPSESVTSVTSANSESLREAKALTTQEERAIGAVQLHVYLKYIKAGGGYCRFAYVYFVYVICAGVSLMNTLWISLWTGDSTYERHAKGFYLGLYALTAALLGFVTFLRSYSLYTFGLGASAQLHKKVLSAVLGAPMSFFDTTPTGRILSRFSKDTYSIDQELNDFFDFFLFTSLSVLVSMGTIIFVTPWFGIAFIPITYVYIRVINYFREVSRETKRLESISRSPVYAHFSETLGGLPTIRAYGESERFISDFESKLDQNIRAFYCSRTGDRWLSIRLELIGAIITGLAAGFSTYAAVSESASGTVNTSNFASLAGLSLTYAISITGVMSFCVRAFAQVEAAMNSCERVFHYSEQTPQEAPATADALEAHAAAGKPSKEDDPSAFAVIAAGGKAIHPSPDWPGRGAITLDDLFMRYRAGTPLVLNGLRVTIKGGERVGVVGRTGSGKSSLLLCLMRIVEPALAEESESYKPPITIDGVDVLRIGLRELRSKLGIIPQNPALFSGTIRSNMDPFNSYSDEQIWTALEKCGMKQAVEEMPDQLLSAVAEYGDNLSQGQRQLLCLGRSLLKQCRILLLDEATSSVDFETDREIQRTLRNAFAGSTVITIAHRVNTIMDSDKILVMKDGVASEYGSPRELLENENSLFSDIVRHSKAENH